MSATPRSINVDQVLDDARLRGLPLIVSICAASTLILDGFDIQVIGFAAPALVAEFDIERAALAPALAASLLGMALGSAGIGAIGDRMGRRPTLLISAVLFGLATLLSATATSVGMLAVWRFVTGLGLGGALPTATALMAEFMPGRWRSAAICTSLIGVPIGGMLGAMLAAEIIPAYGWRAIFVVGGVLPLLAAAVMHLVLPESPRFLATRPEASHLLAALLNRIDGRRRYSRHDSFVLSAGGLTRRAGGVRDLFTPDLRKDTVVTSLIFLTNIFAVYAFFNWAPLVLTSMGFDLATAVRSALVFNVAGVVGALAAAWTISRFGSRWPLAAVASSAVAALAWIAVLSLDWSERPLAADGLFSLMIGFAISGASISAVQVGMYAVAAHVFPTTCRASGVGWVLGAGRLGGIISSFVGGALLALGGAAGFFGVVGCVLVLTLTTLLLLRRHIAPAGHRLTLSEEVSNE